MAGDWLKMECCLPEKPEVFQIASIMGIDPDEVFGKLFKVWRWFDAHTETGNAHSVTYALVDRVAGVTGFAEAMAFAGWLVQDGRDLVIPNFERHNGKTAKDRGLTAKRVAKNKAKGNAPVTPAPLPDALPREEKRREEEEQKKEQPTPKVKKAKRAEQTFADWTASLGDVDAIPATDPVFDYAAKVGLPGEFVQLAWAWFDTTYGVGGDRQTKTYADWRAVFRKAVAGGWPKYWGINRQGEYYLTTEGEQARRALA